VHRHGQNGQIFSSLVAKAEQQQQHAEDTFGFEITVVDPVPVILVAAKSAFYYAVVAHCARALPFQRPLAVISGITSLRSRF